MAPSAQTRSTNRRPPRWARPAVDVAMTVVLILQMAPYQTGGLYHEFAGIAFAALFVAHHALNAGWLGRAWRRGTARAWLTIALDLTLVAFVMGLIASGVLMSQHALPILMRPGLAHLTRPLHAFCGYACLLVTAVHVGLHARVLRGYARQATGAKTAQALPHALAATLALACVALGAYAFVRLNVATKLTMGLSFPDGSTPLAPFVLLHLALAAPFVLLGSALDLALRA